MNLMAASLMLEGDARRPTPMLKLARSARCAYVAGARAAGARAARPGARHDPAAAGHRGRGAAPRRSAGEAKPNARRSPRTRRSCSITSTGARRWRCGCATARGGRSRGCSAASITSCAATTPTSSTRWTRGSCGCSSRRGTTGRGAGWRSSRATGTPTWRRTRTART